MELRMWSLCKSIIYPVEANLKKTSARECVLPPSISICLDSHLYSLFCFVLLTSSLTPAPHQETYWFLIYSGDSVNTHSPKIFTAFTSSNSRYACWGQVQASLPSCRQCLLMRVIPQTSLHVKKIITQRQNVFSHLVRDCSNLIMKPYHILKLLFHTSIYICLYALPHHTQIYPCITGSCLRLDLAVINHVEMVRSGVTEPCSNLRGTL